MILTKESFDVFAQSVDHDSGKSVLIARLAHGGKFAILYDRCKVADGKIMQPSQEVLDSLTFDQDIEVEPRDIWQTARKLLWSHAGQAGG